MDGPEIYNTKMWFQDVKGKLVDLTLEDMEPDKHLFDDNVFFIVEVRDLDKMVDSLSGEDLWQLNPEQLYEQREAGNITQTEYVLLQEYQGLDDAERAAFREEHPELKNPRETYLREHPEENAKLALMGQADIYSRAAFDKMREIVEAQGGDSRIRPGEITVGDHRHTLYAPVDGYVTSVENRVLTEMARAAGAPRDKGAGVVLHVKRGHKVRKDQKMLEIYAERSVKLQDAVNVLRRESPLVIEGMLLRTVPETMFLNV